MSFKIDGLDDIIKSFEVLEKALGTKIVKEAETEALQPILEEVARTVPRDTGALSESFGIKPSKPFEGRVAMNVRSTMPYAAAVEYGSKDRPPDGSMRRAYDSKGQSTVNLGMELLSKKLAEAARGG